MRLRYALELVLAVAAGLAIVRIRMHGPDLRDPHVPLDTLVVLYSSFLTGFVLVEVICLYMEAAWRRSPAIWGTGRLTCDNSLGPARRRSHPALASAG